MTDNIPVAMQIPNDLYGTIAECLHEDKHALLALALASKAWCAESQRVLFRIVLDEGSDIENIRYNHGLFCQAIILNPTLGSYVHTYSQRKLICHPHQGADSPIFRPASDMWELTEAALPALVNLKHLRVVPLCDDEAPAPLLEFKGCTFSLRSLVWGFQSFVSTTNRTGAWTEFLRNQHELVHLEVGGLVASLQAFAWLTDDACPNLRSASCRLPSPIVQRPKIVGLRTSWREKGDVDESQIAEIRHLEYLRVPTDLTVISALGGTDSKLVLLEIFGWKFKRDRLLPDFPNLHVLAFTKIHFYVEGMEDAKTQMTIESFRRCPMLEYIIMEDTRGDEEKRYRKLTIPSPVRGLLDTLPDIQNEEFIMEDQEQGKPWWSAYGV